MPSTSTAKSNQYLREWRALGAIAGPMMIAQLGQVGTGVVDTIMTGRYDASDLAAVAIGFNIWLPICLIFIGVMLGATTIIAQDFGAGRIQNIRASLPQTLWLAVALGLLAAPICFFAAPILDPLGLAAETQAKSEAYLRAVAFGLPAIAIFQALRGHTQGIGILTPFAITSVLGFLINIPLNYALINGRWGAPEMGAQGCGWATAISAWFSAILIAFYIVRAEKLKPYLPKRQWVWPHLPTVREIGRIGLPIGLTFFLEVLVFSIIALAIATLGDTAIAAHQIAYNLWDMAYMMLVSIGSAMGTRVGHAIGANDRDAVQRSLLCGGIGTFAIALLTMVGLFLLPEKIVELYTQDVEITRIALALIGLTALFILIDACQVVVSFALRAFKDTRFPFLVTCGTHWLISLPLGLWWGLHLAQNAQEGAVGFWSALILGIACNSAILIWRLRHRLRQPLTRAAG